MTKIFLSAGDLSGDIHCALLVRALLMRHPDWKISALGGAGIKATGAQMLGDTSGLGVIGFTSALATLPRTLKMRVKALQWLEREKPDAAILCDWGGFNTRLLPELKRLQIPVCYYFPPRSWQKSGAGGLQIAPFCARIATPFEWSARRLNEVGARATWVGHPILETARNCVSRDAVRAELGIEKDRKLIAILPGSRALERKIIAPHVAGAVRILQTRCDARFVIAATPGTKSKLRAIFGDAVQIIENRSFDLLRASDAAIVKSGTSTLEASVADCPQVVVYDVPALIRAQVKLTRLQRKVPFVAMPNIMVEREIVPELLGDACRAPQIAGALLELLQNPLKTAQMRADYAFVRRALGEGLPYTATLATADLIDEIVT